MTRQLISSGSVFEEQIGYSRAVAQGPFVFV
ncbi:MAG: RidA family protein, partial [Pseudanabaena sp.]